MNSLGRCLSVPSSPAGCNVASANSAVILARTVVIIDKPFDILDDSACCWSTSSSEPKKTRLFSLSETFANIDIQMFMRKIVKFVSGNLPPVSFKSSEWPVTRRPGLPRRVAGGDLARDSHAPLTARAPGSGSRPTTATPGPGGAVHYGQVESRPLARLPARKGAGHSWSRA